MEEGEESVENLENTRGLPTCEWVTKAAPRREIKNRFKHFLRTFVDSKGENVFFRKIQDMCSHNRQSFEVSCIGALQIIMRQTWLHSLLRIIVVTSCFKLFVQQTKLFCCKMLEYRILFRDILTFLGLYYIEAPFITL